MDDVVAVADAGGDAVGLNCFPQSRRYVEAQNGKVLAEKARTVSVLPICLFVNAQFDVIRSISEDWGVRDIQLHGDESIADAEKLINSGYHVLRAIRLPLGKLLPEEIEERVAGWERIGCSILLDADVGNKFGGEGKRLDWSSIALWRVWRQEQGRNASIVLAGGLTIEGVIEAIGKCSPAAVDVASGVEIEKGKKDTELVTMFCEAALREFSKDARA